MQPSALIPMLWPSEPDWQRPEALAVLDGSPVNCIVLPGPNAAIQEAALRRAVQAAVTPPAHVLTGRVWPGVQRSMRGSTTSDSGPTGPPWVDANGWAVQLARAKHPDKPVWVSAMPPEKTIIRPEHYALAVADSEAYGGRWLIALDPETRRGLLAANGEAREIWQTIGKALRFFRQKEAKWSGLQPLARLGVLSNFEDENEFMGTEILNLGARRHLAYRILIPPRVNLQGLAGVLWVYQKPPEGNMLKALRAFASEGGLLILPASSAHLSDGLPQAGLSETGYRLYTMGKGRVAVAAETWGDPYAVATAAHRLLTRRHDVFRLWNAGASNTMSLFSPSRALTQILNFTGRPAGHPMSAWIAYNAKTAKFLDLFGRTEPLAVTLKNGGAEVSLPPFTSYAAIEWEASA
jgi:hypothetical protein